MALLTTQRFVGTKGHKSLSARQPRVCVFPSFFMIVLMTRNMPRNKAVADGATSFYLDHSVSVRVSRFAYGMKCNTPYRREDLEHRSRSKHIVQALDGTQQLPDHFDIILPKVCELHVGLRHFLIILHRIPKSQKRRSSGRVTGIFVRNARVSSIRRPLYSVIEARPKNLGGWTAIRVRPAVIPVQARKNE